MVDHGAESGWNPWNGHVGVQVFSNIYLAASLAIVIVGVVYFILFRKRSGPKREMPLIKTNG